MASWLKIFAILARNECKYRPIARRAKSRLGNYLNSRGYHPKSIKLSILGDPPRLTCLVIFTFDKELSKFQAEAQDHENQQLFRRFLVEEGHSKVAFSKIEMAFYSWETINKEGGLYWYLKGGD